MITMSVIDSSAAPNVEKPNNMDCEPQWWQAVLSRDANYDRSFVFAVSSTGIYCRPTCAAKRPRRENVTFFRHGADAEKAGYRACLRCRPQTTSDHEQMEIKAICRYIEGHLEEPLTLAKLGAEFGRSPFQLQKKFKAALGITPRAYAESCRINRLKHNLQSGHSVTKAMYDAGYSSSSRLYEQAVSHLGMTPDKYRRGAIAAPIRYTCAETPLGCMLIAATDRGVCAIHFADSESELEHGLRREFPFAARRRDDEGLRKWKDSLLRHLQGQELDLSLPLDIRSTAFQRKVWTYLQSIPCGATRPYSEVAKAIGQPTATRAVARACATNPVALAIPCHRVVSRSGEMAGYRWGVERKKALLAVERAR
jgi:AraC family transcriptional regulator of adaptative response/methylated-DNA-[protein]-cysteine methyltransferase